MDARLPEGLTGAHFGVVNHLMRMKDGQTPLEIARAFQLPKTTMTHTLAGLEKHQMVEMRPNPGDGRSKQVWLTKKGREFRDQAIAALAPGMADLASRFPEDKIAELVEVLSEIRQVMDSSRD